MCNQNRDLAYFAKRAEEEMTRAGEASCPKAAAAHRALAGLYWKKSVGFDETRSVWP